MSWDTRVVHEAIVVYFVRCSTCNLNIECANELDAEQLRSDHWRAHDERYAASDGMDLGYNLNPDPETQLRCTCGVRLTETALRNKKLGDRMTDDHNGNGKPPRKQNGDLC